MPSEAYKTFKTNLEHVSSILYILDVDKETLLPVKQRRPRKQRHSRKPGRQKSNHINRSALILLCASWEQYIVDVVFNSVEELIKFTNTPLDLPKPAQQKIGISVQNSKNNLKSLELAGSGWEKVYRECVKNAIEDFRSPTCENVNALLNQSIGVTYTIFSKSTYSQDSARLKNIIDIRNDIAHRGVEHGPYTTLQKVKESIGIISRLATKTDNYLNNRLKNMHPEKIPPWDEKAKL